jgi:hypothetical protein
MSKEPKAMTVRAISVLALLLALAPCLRAPPAQAAHIRPPVLAFFYPWYKPSSWCLCRMSDLPPVHYDSSSVSTIDRQLHEATNAGINGFISSWWGKGDVTDTNFASLQLQADALQKSGGPHFASTIYLESDAPALKTAGNITRALRYVLSSYADSPYFMHWHGKPVIFIWDALGGGRTLATWAAIRRKVDPSYRSIWSAEGTDTSLLTVFDGLHLFSAAYWAIPDHTIAAADAGFRSKIDAFNAVHHTHRIWAAGVLPGWNDMRVVGRPHPFVLPRHNGATYRQSWDAALASRPDWITITTFNEWYEGAMIEPSVRYHHLYLDITRHYTIG